jgi:uncharacterized peroxidase-related enzyme
MQDHVPATFDVSEEQRSSPALNLAVVEESSASPEVRELYAQFRQTFGRSNVPGIITCFATHPPLLRQMIALAESMLFSEGALGRTNKELLATFVSARNRCPYCADSHGSFLTHYGGSTGMLSAALSGALSHPSLDGAQQVLLRFAAKITDDAGHVTPADINQMRAAGWTDLQIAETIHLAALFACFNRVATGFGLPPQGLLTGAME